MRGVGKRVSVSSVRTGLSKDKFAESSNRGFKKKRGYERYRTEDLKEEKKWQSSKPRHPIQQDTTQRTQLPTPTYR